jgi:hypothetical protein
MDTTAEKQSYSGNAAAAFAREFIAGVDPSLMPVDTAAALAPMELQAMAATSGATAANTLTIATPITSSTSVVLDAVRTNLLASQGLKLDATATAHGVSSGSLIELAGSMADSTLTAELRADSSSDTVLLKLNPNYSDNHDATATYTAHWITFDAPGVESLYIESTAHNTGQSAGVAADGVANWLSIPDDYVKQLVVTGDQAISVNAVPGDDADLAVLEVVDASRLTAPDGLHYYDGAGDYGFNFGAFYGSSLKLVVGAQHSTNHLIGSFTANTIVGGELDDAIYGGGGHDMLTGGGGHDLFGWGMEAIPSASAEITDFVANTVGQGSGGAATSQAARNGDVIDLSWFFGLDSIWVGVADSSTYAWQLMVAAEATHAYGAYAALDVSTGLLTVGIGADGSDAYLSLQLDGVTDIGAAAFLLGANVG